MKIEKNDDVIFKNTSSAICGFDIYILNGIRLQPILLIMGHEFIGIVEEIGNAVTHLIVGSFIIVPFPIACGNVLPLTNTSRVYDKFKIKKRIA